MIAYLDTQTAIWLVEGQMKKLTAAADAAIRRSSLLISPMVLLEFEFMLEIRRTVIPAIEMAARLKAELYVEVCPLSFPSIAHAALSEKWTRDPFDRLIVAHARANRMAPLISSDQRIRENYPGTVWVD